MKILCIGDAVGNAGRRMISEKLSGIIGKYNIDFTILNGENLAHGHGINRKSYDEMTACGVDAFTLGNHTWDNKEVLALLAYKDNIVRPANYSDSCPGRGSCVVKAKNGVNVGIINIAGKVFMDSFESPFESVKKEINLIKSKSDVILVDFHAEATSEKKAMGWFLDGEVSAVFGTHTHVQTADATVLTKGTGYITDLGMTGSIYSVLGVERKPVIERFATGMPQRFEVSDGESELCGCVFEIENGKTISVESICIR